MVDRNPYTVPFEDLNVKEKAALEAARKVLEQGDMLYGEDLTHVNWTLSQAVHLMELEHEEYPQVSLYFELVLDESGYGIRIIQVPEEYDSIPDIPEAGGAEA